MRRRRTVAQVSAIRPGIEINARKNLFQITFQKLWDKYPIPASRKNCGRSGFERALKAMIE
jgi:hypothetical protein